MNILKKNKEKLLSVITIKYDNVLYLALMYWLMVKVGDLFI